ncbi:MAG: hypothetical protein WBW84_14050 [Acidobacteriaceae bacterium]
MMLVILSVLMVLLLLLVIIIIVIVFVLLIVAVLFSCVLSVCPRMGRAVKRPPTRLRTGQSSKTGPCQNVSLYISQTRGKSLKTIRT